MNWDELVTEVRDLTKDKVEPYLTSDDTITRRLQEAERIMCRRTHILVDSTITVSIVAGTNTYTLPDRVLRVYAARVQGETSPLDQLRGAAYGVHLQDTQATPRVYATGMGDRKITLYPSPAAAGTLELICAVTPEKVVRKGRSSEIPDEHQRALIDYTAAKCLITNDVDGDNPGTARDLMEEWEIYVRDLKRDIYRYRSADALVMQNWTGKARGTV